MEIVYSGSNRIGRFQVAFEVLDDRALCEALFSKCVVLASEPHESGRGTGFIAASDLFQELTEGEEIPEYRIDVDHLDGKFTFKAIRQIIIRAPSIGISHALH